MNSGPLSERIFLAASIAMHSLVYSSITVSNLTALPSSVLHETKSYAQTWFGLSGLSLMHEPSFSQSLPLFGCFLGTFSPSRLHMRSTRLWFTCQPRSLSNAVILRYNDRTELPGR